MADKAEVKKDLETVQPMVAARDYEGALSLLIDRARRCAENSDTVGVDTYTTIARGVLTTLESDFGATRMNPKAPGEIECFVCGEKSETELVAGANGAICRKCTGRIYEHFEKGGET